MDPLRSSATFQDVEHNLVVRFAERSFDAKIGDDGECRVHLRLYRCSVEKIGRCSLSRQ
jgi:hypothetical protein